MLKILSKCNEEGLFKKRIVTQVEPLKEFYTAENYHMNYFELNQNQPYCEYVIAPKIEKFKLKFKSRIKIIRFLIQKDLKIF